MKKKIVEFLVKEISSEEGRKRLLYIVIFIFFIAFFPIIMLTSINPFSPFNKDATDDPYINVYKKIKVDKKVAVDINILRAVDSVAFKDSTDGNSIEKRANKYLYTEKKIVKKEEVYMHDYIDYPGDSNASLKDNDIKSVKKKLLALGYAIEDMDGIFDDKTKSAVQSFQKSKGINPQDGIVNQVTWDALFNSKLDKDVVIKNKKCYRIVEKTYTVYIAKSFDEVIEVVKADVKLSSEDIKTINELYQYALLDSESGSGEGGNIQVPPMTANTEEFIKTLHDSAETAYREYGVLPSITLAQGILESGSGGTALARKANNLFGIKADSGWAGQSIQMPTNENYGGVEVTVMANFRVYDNWTVSVEDHGKFLKGNRRYAEHGVFNSSDYVEQANALQAAGYATDPQYAAKLISIIREYKLDKYDKE